MIIFTEILLVLLAYLLGSIPCALIISKTFFNIDIRKYGSKNMGATNVLRVLGLKYGIVVFLMDALKAGLIVLFFRVGLINQEVYSHIHPLVYGIIAIIGHLFPIFAKFKGGKGVACAAGIFACYAPLHFLIAISIFIIVFLIFRYVSVASLTAVPSSIPISLILKINGKVDIGLVIFCVIASIFIIIAHRKNIVRLLTKKESKTTVKNKGSIAESTFNKKPTIIFEEKPQVVIRIKKQK